VDIGRRSAATGVPAARFDLPGLGDSDGDTARTFERNFADDAETLAVIDAVFDHLQGLGVAEKFVPAGLCLGAYFAVRTVLENDRTVGAIAINPPTLKWRSIHQSTIRRGLAVLAPELIAPAGGRRERLPRPLRSVAGRIEHLGRSFELEARRRLANWVFLWRLVRRGEAAETAKTLDMLAARGARVLFLLAAAEPVLKQFNQPRLTQKLAATPLMEMERLPTHDHILRPLPSQEAALEHVSAALRSGLLSVRGR
jgi:alpha-beta hydrolase superfamily lysophospholipase